MKVFAVLVLMMISFDGMALSKESIGCIEDPACGDGCVHFSDGTIANLDEPKVMKLIFKNKKYILKEMSRQNVVSYLGGTDVPGDMAKATYKGKGISIVFTQKVTDTSCYEKQGRQWISVEKCCSTESDVIFDITHDGGSGRIKTEWSVGC